MILPIGNAFNNSNHSLMPYALAGWQEYEEGVPRIPAAAITVEDADIFLRLYRRGETLSIQLIMADKSMGVFQSRNLFGEVHGWNGSRSVVVSGHIDSWDIGAGALDDGAGSFISWKAVQLIRDLIRQGLPLPKYSLRAALWTGEEQGKRG